MSVIWLIKSTCTSPRRFSLLTAIRRNPTVAFGGVLLAALILMAIFAPFIAIRPFADQVLPDQNKVPQWIVSVFPTVKSYAKISTSYPLGADNLGRDLFSRILYGSRISLAVAIIAPVISMTVGATFGTISGYFGGFLTVLNLANNTVVASTSGSPNPVSISDGLPAGPQAALQTLPQSLLSPHLP